jgi:hypothetical protein
MSALIDFLMKLAALTRLARGIEKTPLQLELFKTNEFTFAARKTRRREEGFYL